MHGFICLYRWIHLERDPVRVTVIGQLGRYCYDNRCRHDHKLTNFSVGLFSSMPLCECEICVGCDLPRPEVCALLKRRPESGVSEGSKAK